MKQSNTHDSRTTRLNPNLLALAREMRHDAVPAEQKLWHAGSFS